MPVVDIPAVGTVNFPDSMSMEDINKEAEGLYADAQKPAPTTESMQPQPAADTPSLMPGAAAPRTGVSEQLGKWLRPEPKPDNSEEIRRTEEGYRAWIDQARKSRPENVAALQAEYKAKMAALGVGVLDTPEGSLVKPVMQTLDRAGKVALAGFVDTQDALKTPFGEVGTHAYLENLKAFANNPDAPLPIHGDIKDIKNPVQRVAAGVAGGLIEMVPKIGATAGLGAVGVPSMPANMVAFGFDKEGKPDPVGMAMVAGGPLADKAGRAIVASAFFKDTVKKLAPDEIKALYLRVNQGVATAEEEKLVRLINEKVAAPGEAVRKGITINTPAKGQAVAEFAGGQFLQNSYMLGLQLPSILESENPKEALAHALATQIALGLMNTPEFVEAVKQKPGEPSINVTGAQAARAKTAAEAEAAAQHAADNFLPTVAAGIKARAEAVEAKGVTTVEAKEKGEEVLSTSETGAASVAPVPETSEAITKQFEATLDPKSTKAVTLLTPGTPMPQVSPLGLELVATKHGAAFFNPEKTTKEAVLAGSLGKDFDGTLLGMSQAEKPEPVGNTVVQTTKDGVPVLDEVVAPTPEAIAKATEAHAAAVPGGETKVVEAEKVIEQRTGAEPKFKEGDEVAFPGNMGAVRGTVARNSNGALVVESNSTEDIYPLHAGWKPSAEVVDPKVSGAAPYSKEDFHKLIEHPEHIEQPLREHGLQLITSLREQLAKRGIDPDTATANAEPETSAVQRITGSLTRVGRQQLSIDKNYKRANPLTRDEALKQLGEVFKESEALLKKTPTLEEDAARETAITARGKQLVKEGKAFTPEGGFSPEIAAGQAELETIKNRHKGRKPSDVLKEKEAKAKTQPKAEPKPKPVDKPLPSTLQSLERDLVIVKDKLRAQGRVTDARLEDRKTELEQLIANEQKASAPATPELTPDEQLDALEKEFPDEFDDAQDQYWMEQGQAPEIKVTVSAEKIAEQAGEVLTPEQAKARWEEWRKQLENVSDERRAENGNKIILSLFDRTGVWSAPFLAAGYDVRTIDLEIDDVDVLEINQEWLADYDMTLVHGVLAANPCTDFAVSGARWWKEKDDDGRTEAATKLAQHTLAIIEYLKPSFWALENPVGRLGELTGIGKPRLQFQPHNYGDPYTKRTQLFGNFNPDLPQANVEPTEGSKIHKLRGDVPEQKAQRSETPQGFALSFAVANMNEGPAARVREIIEEKLGKAPVSKKPVAGPIGNIDPASETAKQEAEEEYKSRGFNYTPEAVAIGAEHSTLNSQLLDLRASHEPTEELEAKVRELGRRELALMANLNPPIHKLGALLEYRMFPADDPKLVRIKGFHFDLINGRVYKIEDPNDPNWNNTGAHKEQLRPVGERYLEGEIARAEGAVQSAHGTFQALGKWSDQKDTRSRQQWQRAKLAVASAERELYNLRNEQKDAAKLLGTEKRAVWDVAPRKAGELEGLTDTELDSLLDEASGVEPVQPVVQAPPVKAPLRYPSDEPKTKSAGDIAAEAAKLGVKGAGEALKGLHDLFGGGAHMGSGGPSFDEKTYEKAKPHFEEAYKNFKGAGKSLGDFLKFIFQQFGAKVREYVKRFIKEQQALEALEAAGKIDKRGGKAQPASSERPLEPRDRSAEGNDPSATGGVKPAGDDNRGRVGSEQPGASPGVGSGREPTDAGTGSTGSGERSVGKSERGRSERSGPARDLRDLRGSAPDAVNYVITPADKLGEGGPKVKARDNFTAIRLVKKLTEENRLPTAEEKAQLVRYVGWGGLKGVFDPKNATFAKEFQQLRELLTPEEYERARSSIQDAHYTSETIITRGVYAAMQRFGFRGGNMVEGGVGIGNFIGLMPPAWRDNSTYLGIERDPLTAKIASYLYPEAKILNMGYQDADLQPASFDGAVGNPPFGKKAIYDKNFKESSKHSIHNFFIAKTLELVKPGGVAGFVVSRYFLDAVDPAAREHIATLGEFLGAIRLPNTAFKENANTEVVTDLVFFKRVPKGVATDTAWTKTGVHDDPANGLSWPVNQWVLDHPEMVLGEMTKAKSGLYGKEEMSVEPRENQDLGADLDAAVVNLPKNVHEQTARETKRRLTTPEDVTKVPDGVKVGNLYVTPQGISKRLPDVNDSRQGAPVVLKAGTAERVKLLVPVRDALNTLVRAELAPDSTPEQVVAARKELNRTYDKFVKKFGFLNSSTNRRAFFEDTDNMRVLGLERDYTQGISAETAKKKGVEAIAPSAKKADIFERRVNAPYQEITSVDTPKEALTVSLNQRGRVDLEHMAELTGMAPETILDVLEGLVFKTPEGNYESKEEYLSGNVRAKLRAAEAALGKSNDTAWQKNIDALKPVIPADIAATDIIAPVGAPWVEAKDVAAFATELTGSAPRAVLYQKANAGWTFNHSDTGVASTEQWGTKRMPFGEMFKTMLNGKAIVVYDYGIKDERIINQPQTELANAKASEVREKWQDWLWQDKERRDRLHRIYNDSFNNYVDFRADGSHLTLPGASAAIVLNPHQKNVAWRTITNGGNGLLYDHVVGAGKTFAGVASMMELKRLGRVRKWLVTVPNHLTGQWSDAFTQLYPNANILAAKASDFSKDNRQKLFSKILTGDYDAVILGHSSLKKVGTSAEVEAGILNEMMREIVDTIQAMKDAGGGGGSRAIAQMEKTKDNLEAKLKKLADISARDTTAAFEELGFDGMFVDEAHEFKNLFYTTQMQNVAGLGNQAGSAKAFDLYLKTRFLRNQYQNKAPIVFATGTPISNSLVEMFTMQRYLQPQVLEEMGLKTLDAWARVFADVRPVYEVDPTGTGYRMATRLANFQNVGELTAIYRNMADVITMNDLQAQSESAGKRFPVPKVKGGKPVNHVAERTPEQAEYFGIATQGQNPDGSPQVDGEGNPVTSYPEGTILWRVDNMPDDPREDNMLKLTNDARKAGLDMRLINPSMPDRPESKINKALTEIMRVHKEWAPRKGTQLVFCDLSVPSSARGNATKKAKTGGAGYYIQDAQGKLKPATEAKPVAIQGAEGYEFFVRKTDSGAWMVSERTSGVAVRGGDTRADAIARTEKIIGEMPDRFKELVAEKQPTADQLAEFAAQLEPPEAAEADDTAEAPPSEGVSVDELLADQSTFSVYDDMKAKLLKAGVPEREIAFIHDYDSPEAKMKLFKAVKAGDVRILFGSTAKMGAGMNVQDRIVALHHMDAPWRPSDLEQREGRAIRQGNEFYKEAAANPAYKTPQDYDADPNAFAVEIHRYATALTYDTRMWQIQEHKAAGIEGFRRADRSTRTIEDVAGAAANASDMKAAASGDPLIQEELQLRNEAKKLDMLKRAWTNNRNELQNREAFLRDYDLRYQSRIEALNKVKATLDANTKLDKDGKAVFEFTLPTGKKTDEKGTALDYAVEMLKEGKRGYFGNYRGFDFSFEPRVSTHFEMDAEGKSTRVESKGVTFYLGKMAYDNQVTTFGGDDRLTGAGLFQRFDNFLGGHESNVQRATLQRDEAEKTLAEVRAELAKPFTKEAQLVKAKSEHEVVRTQLLNKKRPKPAAPTEPGSTDLDTGALGEVGMGAAKPAEAGRPTIGELIPPRAASPALPGTAPATAPAPGSAAGVIASLRGLFTKENAGKLKNQIAGTLGTIAGRTFPRITQLSRPAGEAAARYVSSRTSAPYIARLFARDVLTGLDVDPVQFGAALSEDNLRSVKESNLQSAADATDPEVADKFQQMADDTFTFVGDGKTFRTEAEYQAFLNRGPVREAIERHKSNWDAVIEPMYREAMQLDPDVELPARGLQTGARVNLAAIREGEPLPPGAVQGATRGGLLNTLRRKSQFGIRAKGTGAAYAANYNDLIENSVNKQLEIANKNTFDNTLVEKKLAVIGKPGLHPELGGEATVAFPLKRQTLILPGKSAVPRNQFIYVRNSIAREYRNAANVEDNPYGEFAAVQVGNLLNRAALAGLTDATVHLTNLTTAMAQLPVSKLGLLADSLLSAAGRLDLLAAAGRTIAKGAPEAIHKSKLLQKITPDVVVRAVEDAFWKNHTQLAELAEIGAVKPEHVSAGLPGLRQMSDVIQWYDRTTRMVLDDAYQDLAARGIVENNETARREFVNQVGQYNRRAQGALVRLSRDLGTGPFVTAGRAFNVLGVRGASLNPGVKATSAKNAALLRANAFAKWLGAFALVALLNYLLTGKMGGRKGTPIGSVDQGSNDEQGRMKSFSVINLTGQGRALRVTGLRGAIEAKQKGLPGAVALDSAERDIVNSWISPFAGPLVKFGFTAASGYAPAINVGRVSKVVAPGESQAYENFWHALKDANPVVAGIDKATEPGKSWEELVKTQLPRFTMQTKQTEKMIENYPAIVRRAQANAFVEDVIRRARYIEKDDDRRKFVRDALDRLDPQDREHAKLTLRFRKIRY